MGGRPSNGNVEGSFMTIVYGRGTCYGLLNKLRQLRSPIKVTNHFISSLSSWILIPLFPISFILACHINQFTTPPKVTRSSATRCSPSTLYHPYYDIRCDRHVALLRPSTLSLILDHSRSMYDFSESYIVSPSFNTPRPFCDGIEEEVQERRIGNGPEFTPPSDERCPFP